MFTLFSEANKHGYNYTCPQYPGLSGHTNYSNMSKKVIWTVEYQGTCELVQTNKYRRWLNYIPIINSINTFLYHRKYDLFLDGKCIGFCDKFRAQKKFKERLRFMINGVTYYNGIQDFIMDQRLKAAEWAIEDAEGKIIATMKKQKGAYVYYIEPLTEVLDIRILTIMAMMADVNHFSIETEPFFWL